MVRIPAIFTIINGRSRIRFSVPFGKCLKQAMTASLHISIIIITTPAFNATLSPINETGKKWLNKPRINHYQQFIVRLHEVDKP